MRDLKQSTARVVSFFMVSSTDHLSAKTSAAPAVNISKNGGAFGAAAGAVAELTNGWYTVSLTTVDTGTLGDLAFHITGTGADDTDFADQVVAIDLQDGAALGLSRLDAAISSRSTYAGGAVASVTAAVTVGTNNDKTGYALSAAGVQGIWDALTSALTTAGSIGKLLVDNINATISSRMATFTLPTNFSALSITAGGLVDITQTAADKVWSTATRILTAGTNIVLAKGTGVTGFTDISASGVENAVWDAVRASHTTAGSFGQGAASVQGNVTGSVASLTTNNDKTGYALSSAGVQAVWDEATASTTTVGSIGKRLADFITGDAYVRLGAPAGASVSADVAAVKADSAAIKLQTDTLAFTSGKVNSHVITTAVDAIDAGSLAASADQEIADALLDRADAVETGLTPRGALRLLSAAIAGKASGLATTTAVFRNAVADTKARVTATVDVDGNRTAVTTDTT